MARRSHDRFPSVNIWPAFVDVLSTMLIITIFALLVFMLAQFFLGQTLSARDETIDRLTGRANELAEMLALEKASSDELRMSVSTLTTRLTAETRRAEEGEDARGRASSLSLQLEELRNQLAAIQEALDASQQRAKDQDVTVETLRTQLNAALAEKVQELRQYRSEFFGRLRRVLGERDDIRIVGDRFVFQSEVLFPTASATLQPEGEATLRKIAETLVTLSKEIPKDVDWILRVDGHTDRRPINTTQFRSNWELSSARAISVVNFLISHGVPPDRLAAAGFGSFQPIEAGDDEASLDRNRRIELKLDQR